MFMSITFHHYKKLMEIGIERTVREQSSGDQSSRSSLTDKICRALNSGAGVALIPLLHAAGIATGGTLNAAVAAATALCAARG